MAVAFNLFIAFLGAVFGMTVHAVLWTGEPVHWADVLGNLVGGIIGAGGALAGVIIAARTQERREGRLRLLQGASILAPVANDVAKVLRAAKFSLKHARRLLGTYEIMAHPNGGGTAHTPMPAWLQITAGAQLESQEDRLYLLGEDIATRGARLIALLRALSEYLGLLMALKNDAPGPLQDEHIRQVEMIATNIIEVAEPLRLQMNLLTRRILRDGEVTPFSAEVGG